MSALSKNLVWNAQNSHLPSAHQEIWSSTTKSYLNSYNKITVFYQSLRSRSSISYLREIKLIITVPIISHVLNRASFKLSMCFHQNTLRKTVFNARWLARPSLSIVIRKWCWHLFLKLSEWASLTSLKFKDLWSSGRST